MPFVAPKATTVSGGGGTRNTTTTNRPPWVRDDGTTGLKSTTKTTVPWARKTNEEKENLDSSGKASSTVNKTTNANVNDNLKKYPEQSNSAAIKKLNDPPTTKTITPVRKEPEIHKKVTPTRSVATERSPLKKKEPTPPSSSEEEEDDDDDDDDDDGEEEEEEVEEETEGDEESVEEETEEESENEFDEKTDKKKSPQISCTTTTPATTKQSPIANKLATTKTTPAPTRQLTAKKSEEESELTRRFTLEKPKLRPVVIKRDKSLKKIEDDPDADEGETEEERERRLRFKLDKPKLRHVKRDEKPLPSKSSENILKIRPTLKKVPKIDEIIKESKEEPKPEFKTKALRKTPSIKRDPSVKNVPAPPPLPSLIPKAPPPPPPPLNENTKRELTPSQKATIERLRTRPRKRPDWSDMMKEVENGKKLRHVECNDRSQPILTCKSMTKVDNKFIYETEKENSHNKLLKQIQSGVKLRPTQTNDRSKPILEGLRKFRRQMTIEEQLQKSQSKVNLLAASASKGDVTDGTIVNPVNVIDSSSDELDDIDKIRDDLQSTKQMLALELRNREAQERENKKLLAKIATLEAELEREKSREKTLEYGSRIIVATMETTPASEEAYLNSLKQEAAEASTTAKDLEKKYNETSEMLDQAKSEIEEQKHQIQMLERKLAQILQDGGPDSRRGSAAHNGRGSSSDLDFAEFSASDPDEPEEKKTERRQRRLNKEVKCLRAKLAKLKMKQETAKKEKDALKQTMKNNHIILKEENKKFKKLEKEVHKMAASMREEHGSDEDSDDEAKKAAEESKNAEDEESENETEESEESESEESDEDTESESESEDASNEIKKQNLEPRVKKHETRLSAMKKCNVLLQANVDNLQDKITNVRSKAANLQSELDAVLADLGF